MTPLNAHIGYRDGTLHIEGVPAARLIQACGSPTYAYSTAAIAANYDALAGALTGLDATICFAVKANSNLAVIAALAQRGAGADVVSGGELARALAAGVPPGRIIFSGVGKTAAELVQALDAQIHQINVESVPELELLSSIAHARGQTARIALRINPDVDAETHEKISTGRKHDKFGIDIDDALAVYARAAELPGIQAAGIAVHIGSQLLDLAPWRSAFSRIALLVHALRDAGHAIDSVDLGGGLGIAYHNEQPPPVTEYARLIRDGFAGLGCRIVVEPGRYMVGNAGVLLAQVIYVKHSAGIRYLILDAAMNDLIRPTLYDAHHALVPVVEAGSGSQHAPYEVVGPICESGDFLAHARNLPPLAAGDGVAVLSAGAYGFVMASRYNTRPMAAEVMVAGEQFAVVRQRETLAEILAAETIPDWRHAPGPVNAG